MADPAAPPRPSLNERLLVSAAVISSFFAEFLKFGLAIWLYQESASVTLFAALSLAAFLPGLLLAPIIGIWLDGTDKLRALRLTAAVLALIAATGLGAALAGTPAAGIAFLLAIAISVADAVESPAFGAVAVSLVARDRLQGFNGLTEAARSASIFGAPIFAGVVIDALSPAGLLGLATITMFGASILLLAVRPGKAAAPPRASPAARMSPGSVLRDTRATLGLMFRQRDMARLLLTFACLNAVMSAFLVVFYPLTLTLFSTGETAFVRASMALGMVVGGLAARAAILRPAGSRAVTGSAMVIAAMFILLALFPSLAVVLALQFAIGGLLTAMQAKSQTLWQEITPEPIMGQVFSSRRMVAYVTIPFAYAATPLLVAGSRQLLETSGAMRVLFDGGAGAERLALAAAAFACLPLLLWLCRPGDAVARYRTLEG